MILLFNVSLTSCDGGKRDIEKAWVGLDVSAKPAPTHGMKSDKMNLFTDELLWKIAGLKSDNNKIIANVFDESFQR